MTDGDEPLDANLDEQSYDIKDELEIRKLLEEHTEWDLEFTKNEKYSYDLRLYQWDEDPTGPDSRTLFGYVELERADRDGWLMGGIPDNWVYYSFLERKIRDYDYTLECWGGLKQHYRRTIYLKFNHVYDNCFAAPVATIFHDGFITGRSDGSPTNTYRALPMNHPHVHVGIESVVTFIDSYLSSVQDGQTSLVGFGDQEDPDYV